MTLDQYLAHMQAKLKEFEDNWKENNAKKPDDWPMEFDSQFDWQEQFNCWLG